MVETFKTEIAVKKPLLFFVGLALFGIFSFFGFFNYVQWKHHFQQDTFDKLASVSTLFSQQLELETRQINILTDRVVYDKELQDFFLARDRQELQHAALPLFSDIKKTYDITHLYFIDQQGRCFLRVHNPERNGDIIDRFTMKQAASSGKIASGIELGPFGTFTLRVVRPWMINGKLAGYVELGREIEHITPELKKILNMDLFFLVNKRHLMQEKWQEGLKMMGRSGKWDEVPGHVVIDRTMPEIPAKMRDFILLPHEKKEKMIADFSSGGRTYKGGFVPLHDASGAEVGEIIVLLDYTEALAEHRVVYILLFLCGGVVLLVYVSFFFYTGHLQGGLQRSYGLLHDEIETRKKTEEKLKKHEERLENIVKERTASLEEANQQLILAKEEWEKSFDAMEEVVTIQDVDMNIVRLNKAAHKLFDREYGDLIGKKCYELFRGIENPCPNCPVVDSLRDNLAHSEIIKHEKIARIFHVSAAPIYDSGGNLLYMVHVARDVTEKKKLEDDLFQARKMEAIGTLAGGIAHDFNNILSAILGFAQIAREDAKQGRCQPEDLEQVIKAGKRAQQLVRQILAFSRKGGEQLLQPIEPYLIVKESLKLMRATLPSSIEIREDISAESGIILADPTRVQQVVVNLCTNGLQAMESEKGVLTVSLQKKKLENGVLWEGRSLVPGEYVVLMVRDTGHGMDKDTLARIFEPYFTTKKMGSGTGMGLAMVHGIILDCGGMIEVESQPGQGTVFRVYFPAFNSETPEEKSDQTPSQMQGTEHVLVVDDEEPIVTMQKKTLEKLGYQVTGLTGSLDALRCFKDDPNGYDLVITDQTMPVMNGMDLAREILAIRPGMPVILCTGFSRLISPESAETAGLRRLLTKPVTGNDLAEIVRKTLDGV
ncbi:MAG: ATP-binding protein [Pseudomonadota bacterium]